MGWQTLTVTASSGSKTVSVVSGSTANIKVGDALQVGAFSLCEITGVYAGQLTIKDNWGNATQTGASASVIPTFGDFNTAVSAINKLKLIINDNYQALNDWTTGNGEVTFTGLDGMTYTVKSASAMEAFVNGLETGLDNRIVEAIAEVALPEPDVYIPFNDSLQIVRGYGTHDKIDVSAAQDGSLLVDLPTKTVDFSRASGRWQTNKSGEVVYIDVDEPGIGIDGIDCMQSYTNNVTYSENIRSDFGWSQNSGTVINYGVEDPKGEMTASEFTVQSSNQGVYKINSLPSSSANVSIYARVTEGEASLLLGAGNDRSILTINEKWQRLSHQGNGTGTNNFICYCSDIGKTVQLAMAQATDTQALMPYVATQGSPVAAAGDVVSIPMRNNFPAPGMPWTIFVDVEFNGVGITERCIFRNGLSASSGLLARFVAGDKLQSGVSNGDSLYSVTSDSILTAGNAYRCAFRYGNENYSVFVDGQLVGSVATGESVYDLDSELSLGNRSVGTYHLNGALSNFKVFHYAASDAEILAGGKAK